jgi:hypothetical protein
MTTFRSEDAFVGFIAGALVLPWIGWTLFRGLSGGRLPIGRSYVERPERPGPFWALFGLYTASAVMAAVICLDLLFGLRL